MSGGSYNYLCYKDAADIRGYEETIKSMADRLIELGHTDAAKETLQINLILKQQETYLSAQIERLSEVWRSVEWLDSGDSGKDGVDDAIRRYRGETTKRES